MPALVCPVPECCARPDLVSRFAAHLKECHRLYTVDEVAAHLGMDPTKVALAYQRDSQLRLPWWHHQAVVDALAAHRGDTHDAEGGEPGLGHATVPLSAVLGAPYDFRQHQVAHARYSSYVEKSLSEQLFLPTDENDNVTNIIKRLKPQQEQEASDSAATINNIYEQITKDCEAVRQQCAQREHGQEPDILAVSSVEQLTAIHDALESKLATAHKINETLASLLAAEIAERRRLFVLNQCLLDANVEVGLPPETVLAKQRVARDELDSELLA